MNRTPWIIVLVLSFGLLFVTCKYLALARQLKPSGIKGDFKWLKGVRGSFGSSKTEEFYFKEAHFKIPDEYGWQYDSVQIILGWGDEPIFNPCYWKSRK